MDTKRGHEKVGGHKEGSRKSWWTQRGPQKVSGLKEEVPRKVGRQKEGSRKSWCTQGGVTKKVVDELIINPSIIYGWRPKCGPLS